MAMVCTRCGGSFEQQLMCPTCNVRLQFQANLATAPLTESGTHWQHTPWGRILVGLLLAQGLAYGLQQLGTAAGLLVSGDDDVSMWSTVLGAIVLQVLQAVSLLVGGALTGAGQNRGALYASLVGLLNGLVFVALHTQGEVVNDVALLVPALLHMGFGAIGGWLGTKIWKPMPVIKLALAPVKTSTEVPQRVKPSPLSGPIAWVRVVTGGLFVVTGVIWSPKVLSVIIDLSQKKLAITSVVQQQLISYEIMALFALLGAGFAGATTRNGMKQGLAVGIGASAILAGMQLGTDRFLLEAVIFQTASILCLSLAGGWFGGQLFPPVFGLGRRGRIGSPY